jgi:prolyl-tRNA synthetase
MQMGCHGIGVSRIIGAVADTLADDKGLNWPRVIAPYEVVILASNAGLEQVAIEAYDTLSGPSGSSPLRDVVLDDRPQSFAWKMHDADLVGYPIIVVVGRTWKAKGMCEVQCRRLEIREEVPLKGLPDFVDMLLDQL